MSFTDKAVENTGEAVEKIKDVAETVGVSAAVVASETWDKAKDLVENVSHKLADLVDGVREKSTGDDTEDPVGPAA